MPKLFFPFSENMSFDQFSKTLKRQITIKKAKSLDEAKDAIIGAKHLGFSPLVPSKREKNILVLPS